jgi:phosphotransferase system HPr (HPr) family protein
MEIVEKVKLVNKLGLHLRAAAALVKVTSKYKCRILVRKHGQHADGKSLMNLLTLAAAYGSELTFVFEGEDAPAALTAIRGLISNKFGEQE